MFRREKGSIPVTSPPRAVKTGPSGSPCSLRARISPSSTMSMLSAGVPSRMMMSPTAARCAVHGATNQNRSCCCRSAKTCMARSFLTSSSAGDCAEFSVMSVALSAFFLSLNFRQILVHELDDDRAFAYAGSDALHGTVAHITDDKDSRHIRFEQTRVTIEGPRRRPLPIAEKVRAGKNETTLVALTQSKPCRAELRAHKKEPARVWGMR